MSDLRFEWDPAKAADNARKHGVSFEEAETIFADEFGILLGDPDHSTDENQLRAAWAEYAAANPGCGPLLPQFR